MVVFDVEVLDIIAELWDYICFVQSGEAFTVGVNKHTHTHIRTHTFCCG